MALAPEQRAPAAIDSEATNWPRRVIAIVGSRNPTPQGAQNAARELVRCDAPVATLALAENPNGYIMGSGYQLPSSPVPLVKLLAQQSGCFRVVDRAAGLRGTLQEQELRESGVLRKNTTVAKGKGYEAQYTLTPSLTFSEQDAGRGLAGLVEKIVTDQIARFRLEPDLSADENKRTRFHGLGIRADGGGGFLSVYVSA